MLFSLFLTNYLFLPLSQHKSTIRSFPTLSPISLSLRRILIFGTFGKLNNCIFLCLGGDKFKSNLYAGDHRKKQQQLQQRWWFSRGESLAI